MTYVINNPEIDGDPWYNHYTFDSKKNIKSGKICQKDN